MYGAAEPGGEEALPARRQRVQQALPVLLVGIGMCAMLAVAAVAHLSHTRSTVALLGMDSTLTASATAAGFGALGNVGQGDRVNLLGTLGSLAAKPAPKAHAAKPAPAHAVQPMGGSFAKGIVKMAEADAQRHLAQTNKAVASRMPAAEMFKERAAALEAKGKLLREEESRVVAAARKEETAYVHAMDKADAARNRAKKALDTTVKAARAPAVAAKAPAMAAKAPAVAAANSGSVAKEVASMVMSAIEPELKAQQAEIAKLADAKETQQGGAVPAAQAPARVAAVPANPVLEFRGQLQQFPPAFPKHWAQVKKTQETQKAAEKKPDSFQVELQRFMGKAKPFTHPPKKVKTLQRVEVPGERVHGNRKAAEDYKIHVDERYTDAGEGAYGHGEETEWAEPTYTGYHAKGSPCNVGGSCNHYVQGERFNLQDHEHWRKHFLKRYKKACEDGNGNLLEGQEPCEADDEDADEPDGEVVKLGDEQVMRSLDDYVPPNDAYIHNLLTSGAPGVDHFGHLAPMSRQNFDLMYGEDSQRNLHNAFGHDIHSPGRGGLDHVDRADRADDIKLGDDQLGDDDEEVPVALTMPRFPGPDPDHFDHWYWESPLNQELLNGKYWKRLKKDGMMDRIMPAREAYRTQIGDSHDRHPLPDLVVGSWNQGFGYGPSEEEPQPFDHARKETHGENWKNRVFTGTHEDMEMEKGVVISPSFAVHTCVLPAALLLRVAPVREDSARCSLPYFLLHACMPLCSRVHACTHARVP